MSWVLTKQLQAFRDQMDAAFPNRDKKSDGTISDAAHQAESRTGHSPDDTPGSNPEWDGDPDNTPEVRAIDIDSDTGDPEVSMEDIVQHLLRLARAGELWMIRYMIFNRRIWSASGGWAQQAYAGPSPHTEHLHLSGAYTQSADEDAADNYHLEDLVSLTKEDKAWISDLITGIFNGLPAKVLSYDPGVAPGVPNINADAEVNKTVSVSWALRDAGVAKNLGYQARDRLDALATAVAAIATGDTLTGEQLAALAVAVDQVDEQVAARLVGATPEATAAALKAVLGDQAAAVGRILAAA